MLVQTPGIFQKEKRRLCTRCGVGESVIKFELFSTWIFSGSNVFLFHGNSAYSGLRALILVYDA